MLKSYLRALEANPRVRAWRDLTLQEENVLAASGISAFPQRPSPGHAHCCGPSFLLLPALSLVYPGSHSRPGRRVFMQPTATAPPSHTDDRPGEASLDAVRPGFSVGSHRRAPPDPDFPALRWCAHLLHSVCDSLPHYPAEKPTSPFLGFRAWTLALVSGAHWLWALQAHCRDTYLLQSSGFKWSGPGGAAALTSTMMQSQVFPLSTVK